MVPEIDPDYYELELLSNGKGDSDPIMLYLDDLKELPTHEVTTTIACGGNRRSGMLDAFPKLVHGLRWTTGAIGNAVYKGAPVRDLLLNTMGQKEEDLVGKGLHLIVISYDTDFQAKPYEVSIPIEAALDPANEITLAY